MEGGGSFTPYQKVLGLVLIFSAFMVIPLSAGVVLLTQFGRPSRQISAQTPVAASNCDLNSDGIVSSADVAAAADGFGQVNVAKNNRDADVDNNGWVNSADLGAIATNDPSVCK